ncbi:MAG TPA: hypothetical protein PKV39_00720 [bacterium]|nr:hypothetical protein [bacterium]HQK63439.1 hypothetical protein [Methanofastidiosum sp.]
MERAEQLFKLMEQTSFITPEGKTLTVIESTREYQKMRIVDDKYFEAVSLVQKYNNISIQMLMDELNIDKNRAENIIGGLGRHGILGALLESMHGDYLILNPKKIKSFRTRVLKTFPEGIYREENGKRSMENLLMFL